VFTPNLETTISLNEHMKPVSLFHHIFTFTLYNSTLSYISPSPKTPTQVAAPTVGIAGAGSAATASGALSGVIAAGATLAGAVTSTTGVALIALVAAAGGAVAGAVCTTSGTSGPGFVLVRPSACARDLDGFLTTSTWLASCGAA
jgi:hypothetical protein